MGQAKTRDGQVEAIRALVVAYEAAWAHLCGVAPIEASSGKVIRLRLNRGGDRQANAALCTSSPPRVSSDPRTRAYVEGRTKEGRSKKEIIRVLERYVARDIYSYCPASNLQIWRPGLTP